LREGEPRECATRETEHATHEREQHARDRQLPTKRIQYLI